MGSSIDDNWPTFWLEPWRWADPAWHRQYGVLANVTDRHAQRLLFAGWFDAFGLSSSWAQPADRRWQQLLAASPTALQDAAALMGWLAIVRAPGGIAQTRGHRDDRRLARALRYRDVNCFDAQFAAPAGQCADARACGLDLLQRMALADWRDVAGRIAMMAPPRASAASACVAFERIDVARCLSVWLAATRWLSAARTLPTAS
ncbi:hypothetical protein LJR230_002532 [Trinickia sp. LjRoot230]|uniref:hypothetical protein n=1 Tax=Trinickia sp. LjRoot230 TaxID=3342288 RepID=UPI003ECC9319